MDDVQQARIALFVHAPLLGSCPRGEIARRLVRALIGNGAQVEIREYWRTAAGPRELTLSDGARDFSVRTALSEDSISEIKTWSRCTVPLSSPLLVIANPDEDENAARAAIDVPESGELLTISEEDALAFIEQTSALCRYLARYQGRPPSKAPSPPSASTSATTRIGHAADLPSREQEQLRQVVSEALQGQAFELVNQTACDVFIEPRPCCDPSPLRTAALAQRPCIAAAFGENAQLLPHHGLGWPVGVRLTDAGPMVDDEGIKVALREILNSPQAAQSRGARGSAHIQRLGNTEAAPPAQRSSEGAQLRIHLEAPIFASNSYAQIARHSARIYREAPRIDLRIANRQRPERPPELDREFWPLLEPVWTHSEVCLRSGWPFRHERPASDVWVQRFDWEYGALPREIAGTLSHGPDEIWVHSNHVRSVLLDAGIAEEKIQTLPHGYDPTIFSPSRPPLEDLRQRIDGRHAFLFVGAAIPRKGIDALLAAWLSAFQREDRVCLVVKIDSSSSAYAHQEQLSLLTRIAEHPRAPELLLLDRNLSDDEMGRLFTSVDTLVHPFRGEGFGMPILEARGAGLPVIVSAGGAPSDFLRETGTIKIATKRVPAQIPEATLGKPWLLDPDREQLIAALRLAQEHQQQLRSEALADARWYQSEHSWRRRCEAQIERLYQLGMQSRAKRRRSAYAPARSSKALVHA
ncbi:MAG: hypothetical protein CSA62_02765 [Planctomycetota bacterium]|nr:MAG: hypothetical protein CSA62_02765 [Planctomycetota bacterium]